MTLVALLFVSAFSGLAQRQTPGRPSFDGYVTFAQRPEAGFVSGGGMAWCNYNYIGRTTLGVDVFFEPRVLVEDAVYKDNELIAPETRNVLETADVCLSGGYLLRIWAPRSRSVILSAGGTLLAGVSYCKPLTGFCRENGKPYSAAGIFLGLVPEAQLELFPFSNVSFYGAVRPRVCFLNGLGGTSDWFRMSYSFGFKFYI